ncbi:hypothetical protein CEUSTIGMA_g7724.t1 [Chlamydomonas eustigma]|uniref:Protein N-terminal glutamine amidohydrolase n=1 Tax=Chlamydomonas eustigma TaxID=1157962 RepID=A0A250XB46_9CHLO|nr:hypothetical protein CEUSTIGMA_g7724.t1 [Chlamydomonas eustigma]|eukprot:GAX80286.1 hypothetical protein CEUSTIGMA_g7724.t1 [Chlamydomonas eustigma]
MSSAVTVDSVILIGRNNIKQCWVVFISNENKQVPLWFQASGDPEQDGLVVWDYHVIMIQDLSDFKGEGTFQDSSSEALVWDLDSTLTFPTPFGQYAEKALKAGEEINAAFTKLYRVISGAVYLDSFASDRGHMRNSSGEWMSPPPSYPPIVAKDGCVNNIHRFWDMSDRADRADCNDNFGRVLSEKELLQKFGSALGP